MSWVPAGVSWEVGAGWSKLEQAESEQEQAGASWKVGASWSKLGGGSKLGVSWSKLGARGVIWECKEEALAYSHLAF